MKKVMQAWDKAKELVKQGYKILNKEVTMGIPGPCFPAISPDMDRGIGSPYDKGAAAFENFWDGVVDKILLGPSGRTFPPFFSPYESALSENPFFIPLEKWTLADKGVLLSKKTLEDIWNTPKNDTDISFPLVSRLYHKALREMWEKFQQLKIQKNIFAIGLQKQIDDFTRAHPILQLEAKYHAPFDNARYFFESYLAYDAALNAPKKIPTIGDLQVKIPDAIALERPDLFLKNFTLGSPPDAYSDKNQDWYFKTFDPKHIFNSDGSLGEAGKIMYHIFDTLCKVHKGGIRIDHFIGFVNPFVIPRKNGLKEGRLYSSENNKELKKYCKKSISQFADITQKIIIKALSDNNMTVNDLYPEDLGNRPEQLDPVLDLCGLGRMIVTQFVDINDENHAYLLHKTKPQDIATLDTHDLPSVQGYFNNMDWENRVKHAVSMSKNLRFYYTDALAEPKALYRMKWAELFACPARRVQAFFTSFTGQDGRYNNPENPKKWRLRCSCDFEALYFKNLVKGQAFNPLDALSLAIFAKGDNFYYANKELVDQMRFQEEVLLNSIKEIYF